MFRLEQTQMIACGLRLACAAAAGLAVLANAACADEDVLPLAVGTAVPTTMSEPETVEPADVGTPTVAPAPEGETPPAAESETVAATPQLAVEPHRVAALSSLYVGNTGGRGVAVRTACADDARSGSIWAFGSEVILLWAGEGECAGWSHITGERGPSWIRDDYLVTEAPPTPTARASAAMQPASPTPAPRPRRAPRPTATVPAPLPPPAPSLPVLQIPQLDGAVVTSTALDGAGILYGGPSGFDYLGLISSASSGNSVCNSTGPYGSASSATSVRNPAGAVPPHPNADYSAYSSSAENPPRITLNGQVVGFLTRNVEKFGIRAVSPEALFHALGC